MATLAQPNKCENKRKTSSQFSHRITVLVQGIAFDYESDTQGYRQRFIRAWGMVNKIDSKTLGHKNSIPLEPYLDGYCDVVGELT